MNEGDMVCGRFKKVVVTGGAGFIGSHLVKRLLADGCEVCVVDNLSTGKIKNIEEFLDSNAFEFIEGDVRDIDLIMKIVRGKDLIFHLAAMVGVFLIALDPAGTIETNIKGTESILKAAKKFGVRTLIASSSEVYGKSEAVPFCEEDDLLFGSTSVSRWAYACSKAIDEFLGKAFYQQYGLGVVIARFFNTIGPRQTGQYGMVAPRFVSAAINNRPLPIYGNGKQTRCFCYVGDVVKALVGLVNCDEALGKVFNIGSREEISIEGLADKIIEITGSSSVKKFISYEKAYGFPIEDIIRRTPDINRIQKMIGWEPKTSIDEIIQKIYSSLTT